MMLCLAGRRANRGGLAYLIFVSRRKIEPLRTRCAASMTPSGVRKFRHPSSSSSPNTPHDDSLGLSGLIGSSEKRGTLLRSIFVAIASAPWRELRVAVVHGVHS